MFYLDRFLIIFPFYLIWGGGLRGPSPFRFEKMWLEEEGFIFNDSRSFVLDAKLRFLKEVLKS